MKLSEISEIIKFDRVKFTDNYPPRIFKTAQKFKNLEVISMIYKSDKLYNKPFYSLAGDSNE